METIFTIDAFLSLMTLTALEIVLGLDNIIFLTILVDRVPEQQRARTRTLGLGLAMLTRIALLLSITWVMKMTTPLITILEHALSAKDLILQGGGLFLIAKSTHEIHCSLETSTAQTPQQPTKTYSNFILILIQIALIDIIFSLDSVISAVGLANHLWVMISAIIISVVVMLIAAPTIGDIINKHPSLKMLALSFLILIGFTLVAEGLNVHIPKGYIYFAMIFSIAMEALKMLASTKTK